MRSDFVGLTLLPSAPAFLARGKKFAHTNYAQALENVQKSLDRKPTAAALALRGKIFVAQGKRAEAAEAFAAALKLDPAEPEALAGIKLVQ